MYINIYMYMYVYMYICVFNILPQHIFAQIGSYCVGSKEDIHIYKYIYIYIYI
jgi:hypothetical protein